MSSCLLRDTRVCTPRLLPHIPGEAGRHSTLGRLVTMCLRCHGLKTCLPDRCLCSQLLDGTPESSPCVLFVLVLGYSATVHERTSVISCMMRLFSSCSRGLLSNLDNKGTLLGTPNREPQEYSRYIIGIYLPGSLYSIIFLLYS